MSNPIRINSSSIGESGGAGNLMALPDLHDSHDLRVLDGAPCQPLFQPYDEDAMLDQLGRSERLRLVQFVCSFAWADFEIKPEERVFIARLIRRLELDEEEDLQVQQWLDRPPALDDLDPTSIPAAHRRIFVEAIEGLISADGEIAEEEHDSFEIFKQLLAY